MDFSYQYREFVGPLKNDFATFQFGALRAGQTQQFAEHIVLILAQRGRESVNADLIRATEARRCTHYGARR